MDVFDRASEIEAKQTEMALAEHFSTRVNNTNITSAEECIECGLPIPKARQEASRGCQFCITCQALAERGKL